MGYLKTQLADRVSVAVKTYNDFIDYVARWHGIEPFTCITNVKLCLWAGYWADQRSQSG
jgi:hypothetical protein